jgi:hypothetical protein
MKNTLRDINPFKSHAFPVPAPIVLDLGPNYSGEEVVDRADEDNRYSYNYSGHIPVDFHF